jgi:ACS family glucarate transporter-like MFS transporter
MTLPPPHLAQPTRVRWRILFLLLLISIITYIDRVNISVTARQMMPALGLTDLQMGWIFSTFVFGYALFQVPGGWMGDRWGPRRVLTFAVIWWSIFTALTAIAPTLPLVNLIGIMGSLMVVRFLIGIGEAAALPNFNRAVANWHPPQERGLGIGITIGGIGIGSALTPPVTAWIMVNYGWQTAFFAAGLLGIAIALLWYWYATDFPRQHPHVNAAEAAIIEGKSFETSIPPLPSRGEGRGEGGLQGAFFASAPFIAMTIFCPLGGWVTDRLVEKYGINWGRASVGGTGMILAALCIIIGANVESPYAAIGFLSLGAGWLYFTVGPFWSSTTDLSKPYAGTLSGLMNTGANLGGTLSPTLTPWLADSFGWPVALGLAAAIALIGGLCWLMVRPELGLQK